MIGRFSQFLTRERRRLSLAPSPFEEIKITFQLLLNHLGASTVLFQGKEKRRALSKALKALRYFKDLLQCLYRVFMGTLVKEKGKEWEEGLR